jgi:hypothetical protein
MELHSRWRHSDSRTAAAFDGHPDHVWTLIQACKYFLESSWSLFHMHQTSSPYHVGAGRNHYFGAETFFLPTVLRHLILAYRAVHLSPIRMRPRVGARPSHPEVVLPHL